MHYSWREQSQSQLSRIEFDSEKSNCIVLKLKEAAAISQ